MCKQLFLSLFFISIITAASYADSRDSIYFYIDNEQHFTDEYFGDKILDLTNQLFNELSNEEIGAFYQELSPKINEVKNLIARVYLIGINCAYLNNASQFALAEQCCLSEIELGKENNRKDIIVIGLEDLHYVYNHQAKYEEQINALNKAIQLRKNFQIGDSTNIAYDFLWKAEAFSFTGSFDSAYLNIDLASTFAPADNNQLRCNIFERRARVALEQGNYSESMTFAQLALDVAREENLKIRTETNLMYLGYNSFYLGQYEEAISYENEALEMYGGERNSNTASVYNRLGKIYNATKDYETALDFLQKAKSIYEEVDYDVGIARSNLEISKSHLGFKDLVAAEEAINQSFSVFQSKEDLISLSKVYRQLAQIKNLQQKCELALSDQSKAIGILTQSKKMAALGRAKLELSDILLQCSSSTESYLHAKEALDLATKTNDIRTIMNANLALAEIAKQQSRYQEAFEYKDRYHLHYEYLTNNSNLRALAREKSRFQVVREEEKRMLSELKNESLLQKNRTLQLSGALIFALALLLAYFLYRRHKFNQLLQLKNDHITKQKNELEELNHTKDKFFSIIAHDLRSPLVAFQGVGKQIRHYTKREDITKLNTISTQIEELSLRLNNLLDNLLNWSLVNTGKIPYAPQNIVLQDQVKEVIDIFALLAKKKISNWYTH